MLEFPFEESWLQPHIHKPICDLLQDYVVNRRMTIVLPRSWLKSTLCSVYYPIWRAIRDPSIRILIVQNTSTNAEKKLAAIRGQFDKNPLLRVLFPSILPDSSSTWTTKALCLKRPMDYPENTFESAGTKTALTSRHYNLIVEDDTVSPDLDDFTATNVTPSKEDIEQAIGFHRSVTGLLNDMQKDQILIVGTRWYQHDLISWNAENEKRYLHIERAVRELDGVPNPKGEPSYPERFNNDVLLELADAWGPYLFSCLYMNLPMSSADMVFLKDWFRFYSDAPRNLITYTTVDPAGGAINNSKSRKAKAASDLDYNVVMTVGKDLRSGLVYVLDYDRFRGSAGDTINKIFAHQALWGSITVGIEAQQYQNSIEYYVKEQMGKRNQYFMVEMLKSVKAKETRIRALQPLFAAGMIWLRHHHTDLISELEAFPLGAHDDCADALSMMLQLFELSYLPTKTEDIKPTDPMSLDFAIAAFQLAASSDSDNLLNEMLFSEETRLSATPIQDTLTNQFINATGGFQMENEYA